MLLEEIPPELTSIEVKKQPDNANLYDLYVTDPKTFWQEAPSSVRTFRI